MIARLGSRTMRWITLKPIVSRLRLLDSRLDAQWGQQRHSTYRRTVICKIQISAEISLVWVCLVTLKWTSQPSSITPIRLNKCLKWVNPSILAWNLSWTHFSVTTLKSNNRITLASSRKLWGIHTQMTMMRQKCPKFLTRERALTRSTRIRDLTSLPVEEWTPRPSINSLSWAVVTTELKIISSTSR